MADPTFNQNAGGGTTTTTSGGTTSGGTTSSSSSSSSGGSTGLTEAQRRAKQRAERELRLSFLELLRRWGLRPDKNLLNLTEKAVKGQWSSTHFLHFVRQTPDYKKKYHGLMWKDGMTEGQYLSTYNQYKARAQDIGLTLTKQEFARMLKGGVSFDEFSDRVDALASIQSYGPMWDAFNDVLIERGINVPGKKLEKKELAKFLMGRGSKQWEQAWQETLATVNLEKVAGVQVQGGTEGAATLDQYGVTRGDLLGIIKSVEALSPGFNVEDISSKDWADIGKRLRQYNMSYLQRYGLTTKDLLEMELGGPRAAEIGVKAERILKTQEAFTEPRAIPMSSQQVGNPQEEELPQVR